MKFRNFFDISDLTKEELLFILNLESDKKSLTNMNLGTIYEKYSTRTRLSFAVAISILGGNRIDIRFDELNISREESFEDTFKAMSCYLDGLIYRTSSHENLINASKYFDKPMINALSERSHPCQTLGDLITLKERFGNLNLNILWMGDINNVTYSLIQAANLIDEINLTICCPPEISKKVSLNLNNNIKIIEHIGDIDLSKILCVMTDVFISMNDANDLDKSNLLKNYSVNMDLMSKCNSESVFMHCLPAKVGLEVSDDVFRSSHSIVWRQAYNRMIAQKKLLQFIYQ